MDIRMAYGKRGLNVSIPDQNISRVIHMNPVDPVADVHAAVKDSLIHPIDSRPLSAIAQGRESAVIVISDITRPVPNQILLPPILKTLEDAGIAREAITILIATGIHRPNLGEELEQLVGKNIAETYRVVNHYSEDEDKNEFVGTIGDGIPAYIDKEFLKADLKILTGLIEMHLMAGFSGGRKSVLPGIASLETMKHMHGYRLIQKDEVCNGRLENNPFHEAGIELSRKLGVDFIVNVTLDEARNVTGVFSGELEAAHERGCEMARKSAQVEMAERVDIVVTSSGGYPLDKTLYQAIKGLVGALEIIKPGGTVILAAENEEGGGCDEFVSLLRRLKNPMEFYDLVAGPNFIAKDQWMIQELVNGMHHCNLLYYTEGISDDDLRDFLITPIASVEDGIEIALNQHGPEAAICVIPEGPYVLPKLPTETKGVYSWQTVLSE